MLAISTENVTRLRNGITMAIGKRQNRRAIYQFLEAELRALHCSYGFTLRSLVAEQVIKMFMDAVHMLAEDGT
jgi:hypothetical protein